jgi:dipeptidyl aminopeptidase/acylaminoacyl peptidase
MMSEKRSVQPDDLFRLKTVVGGVLLPDGKQIVYAINAVDLESQTDVMTLWRVDVQTGAARRLTAGPQDSNPAFSPDGKTVAFISERGEKPQVYLIAVDGGEARPLTTMKLGVGGGPVWSPDGKQIAFTASSADAAHDPTRPYRVTRPVYRFDGIGYVERLVQDLYVIPADGGQPDQLTANRSMNSTPQWSPDGKHIAFATTLPPDDYELLPALNVVDMNGNLRAVVSEFGGTLGWMPDSKGIVYTGAPPDAAAGTKHDVWIADLEGGAPECRTAGLTVGVGGSLQGDFPKLGLMTGTQKLGIIADGQTAYVQVQAGGSISIYRVALTGTEHWEPIIDGQRSCLFQAIDDDHLVYVVSTPDSPSELFVANLDGADERQLTEANTGVLDELKRPEIERLVFAGVDGDEVEGWLMKPVTGAAPYPTLLYIHGGPRSGFGNIFSFDFQMLAGAGFAVLTVNYHGSTGYGTDFSTRLTGHYCEADYHDLMAGVDHAIQLGLADPDRLGICGLSFGGYLTCWAVGQTDRFKAAVPENPVTDRVSAFGTGDVGVLISGQGMGGTPWEMPEAYVRASPITYAHRCTTPTLLIMGEADYRCHGGQSEQFYTTLKAAGCQVEMLRLPGSPHAGAINGPPPLRRAQNEALLDWMNRHVLGKAARKDIV